MPYCYRCGAKNREGARTCESCGSPMVPAPALPSNPAALKGLVQRLVNLVNKLTISPTVLVLAALALFFLGFWSQDTGSDILMYGGMSVVAYAGWVILKYLRRGEPRDAGNFAGACGLGSAGWGLGLAIRGDPLRGICLLAAGALFGLAWSKLTR